MPRSLPLHPASLAAGFALGVLVLLCMGQQSASSLNAQPLVRVEYMPHPRDMVQIKEIAPFIVPAGKLLVVTGVGGSSSIGGTQLRINGAPALQINSAGGTGGVWTPSVLPIPQGLTAQQGDTVSVHLGGDACAWGYLATM